MSRSKHNVTQTFKVGAAVVNICRGVAPDGHTYLYYVTTRRWSKGPAGKTNYSEKFYDWTAKDHCKAIEQAAKWMERNPGAAHSADTMEHSD